MTRLVLIVPFLIATPASAGELRAGSASVKITPAVGTPMAGYYHMRAAEGVHDDLYAKALVIEKDGNKAALVALDLISTTRELVEAARREIEKTTGVRGEAVMISATHAHTGPVLRSGSSRDGLMGVETDLGRRYSDELPGKIAEAVRLAEAVLAPANVSTAHGREVSIAFNRRFHMKDGSVGWNPGKLNRQILKPAGTIDPDVPVVYVQATDGRPIATYVNYAVHLDNVGGTKFSADMPATLARCLGDFKGPGMVTLWTAGCCGDINHIDVNWAEKQGGFENAARMGTILAGEVLRAWPRLERVNDGALRTKSATVRLDPAPIGPEDVAKARAVVARLDGAKSNPPTFLETVKAFQVLDVEARGGKPIEVEVQVIALGDEVAWVSLPGEIFVELGLAIKGDSPFRHTIIAELANGAIGYIPARRAYAQGNYEVVSARCAEGSGERLVDAAVGLLKSLHREATAGASGR